MILTVIKQSLPQFLYYTEWKVTHIFREIPSKKGLCQYWGLQQKFNSHIEKRSIFPNIIGGYFHKRAILYLGRLREITQTIQIAKDESGHFPRRLAKSQLNRAPTESITWSVSVVAVFDGISLNIWVMWKSLFADKTPKIRFLIVRTG